MSFSEPTRRRALWTLGAAGFATLAAADGVRPDGTSTTPEQAAKVRRVLHSAVPQRASPTPSPVEGPPPPPLPGDPGWRPTAVPVRRKPVTNLRDLTPAHPRRSIALTIDDGPHPYWTPKVLDVLAEHEVTATFFVIGVMVKEYPTVLRRVVEAGHEICNHTMNHPVAFARIGGRRITAEIRDAHAGIADITGRAPGFFRAPGGNWSKRVLETTAEYGMVPIGWEVDPWDWRLPGVASIRRSLLSGGAGAIMLCHDGGGDRSQTVAALRGVLPRMKKRGLTFVPL